MPHIKCEILIKNHWAYLTTIQNTDKYHIEVHTKHHNLKKDNQTHRDGAAYVGKAIDCVHATATRTFILET
jgi:hypothetical protein